MTESAGPDLADRVSAVVRLIPPGRVVSYGDIAELLGIGPRIVGRVMALNTDPELPWWRVVNAAGRLPSHLVDDATRHWAAEGIVTGPSGPGVSMSRYRAELGAWADDAETALGPLPGAGE